MTIIEPHKNYSHSNNEFLYLGIPLFLSAILSIYLYNINVNLKFRLNLTEKTFQQLEVANADFRNQLYQILDSRNLAEFAAKQNLISEKNPAYLEHKSLAAR